MPKLHISTVDDEGYDYEFDVPGRWEICDTCRGEGKSSAYLGAFTASEMAEEGPEFQEDYMNGFYDRTCDECHGTGKVVVAEPDRLDAKHRALFDAHVDAEASLAAEEASERLLMGDR